MILFKQKNKWGKSIYEIMWKMKKIIGEALNITREKKSEEKNWKFGRNFCIEEKSLKIEIKRWATKHRKHIMRATNYISRKVLEKKINFLPKHWNAYT